jgi:hypothetical protein
MFESSGDLGQEPADVDFGAGIARIDLSAIIPAE